MELLIVDSTQKILDESNKILYEKNKKYYRDVLDFLNLMFEDNSKNINNIKFKKITLNENVFNMYNQINQLYKLNKPEFDLEKFDLSEFREHEQIKNIFFDISYTLSNYLLEKLNYKLIKKINKDDNKMKLILKYIN